MSQYKKLQKHFFDNHKNKVFKTSVSLKSGEAGIMFFYNKKEEIENFKQSFGIYLPIFTDNEDNINTFELTSNIDESLSIYSKRTWENSTVMPHRKTASSGLYGELFLDIYLRIVKNRNVLISYTSRRSYKSNNETKGIDSIVYEFNNENIEFYICEAKFVTDRYSAKQDLIHDISISGNGHLSEEYLNSYFGFILKKDISCPAEDREKISNIFNDFNRQINSISNPKNFLDIVKEKNIKLKLICFAIFQGDIASPDDIDEIYQELIDQAKESFKSISITNYEIEVVFIPTQNESMKIKRGIDSFYD